MSETDLFGAIATPEPPRARWSVPRHAEAPRAPRPPPHPEPPRAAAPDLPDPFPVPEPWTRLLSRAGYPTAIVVVSALYTEQILECLADPAGQHMLWRDGRITQSPPADWPPRRRFLTAEEARALHARIPLVIIEWPLLHTVHLRLAQPGDAVLAELPLPPFHDH